MKYAKNTNVSSDKSLNEIRRILSRYGAEAFAYMDNPKGAMVAFRANERQIRMAVALPLQADFEKSPSGRKWAPARGRRAWEQAGRQRWRALALVIKAKLEAVDAGVAEFEQEFMPYIVLPGGKTAGEVLLPEIAKAYLTGGTPHLLLGA